MKPIIKFIMILSLLIGLYFLSQGQTLPDTSRLVLGRVESYRMEATYNKTTHIIFPAAIRYVDLGSDYLIAGKAEDAENVLRVKAAIKDFEEETNFSVITDDGRFYNFNVVYNPHPEILSYDLMQLQKKSQQQITNDVLLKELGHSAPSLTGLLMESIYHKNKQVVRHIYAESYGIRFLLKGVYINDGKFYFHTELSNNSNIPYQVDFVTFKIVDKKLAKRTVVQEKPLIPLRIYKPLDNVAENSSAQNVFLMDMFTMENDQVLLIEIFEKNGGRQQILKVGNANLIHAALIKNMHLKFKRRN